MAGAWGPVFAVVALVTVTAGNLVAMRQQVAVRLLAWSTVAQAGWVLLPLGAARDVESTRDAVSASVAYLLAYAVASLVVFSVVVVLARHSPEGEEHTLESYRGLVRREPVAAAALGLGLISLAGLPPGVMGLMAKVLAVRPIVDGGMWVLAGVAAVNVALGLVYYLRWAALLVSPTTARVPTWRLRPAEGLVLGGAVALTVAVSVYPQVLAGLVPGVLR
jgi:NADH-quinone oxidoreductase subunit N